MLLVLVISCPIIWKNIRKTAEIQPMVDQLELHVGYLQEAAVSYCKKHQIQVQAWSPLGRRRIMEQEQIQKMAEKYQTSTAQFLLTFLLQLGIGVIPKASVPERRNRIWNCRSLRLRKKIYGI